MEESRDVWHYVALVRRRALYFLLPFVLVAAGAFAVVMSLPAIYESRATVLVESQQIPSDFVRSTVTGLASERLQVIKQRVMTRDNILAIAEKFELFTNNKALSKSDVVDRVRERISIEQKDLDLSKRQRREDRLTIAFTIGYTDENPVKATKVANELVTLVLSEDARARTSSATETTKFLEKESNRLAAELQTIEAEISAFKLKNNEALPEKLEFNMSLFERTENNITEADRELVRLDQERQQVTFEASLRAVSASGAAPEGSPQDIERRLNVLRAELVTKSGIYAPSHPEMRALKKAVTALEAEVEQVKKAAAAAATLNVDDPSLSPEARLVAQKLKAIDEQRALVQKQRGELAAASAALKAILVKTPEIGLQIAVMERKRTTVQANLDEINKKFSDAKLGERLEEDQQAERFEVIEQPIVPQKPTKPDRGKLLALGLALAAGLGGGAAFGAETLDSTVRSSFDLSARTGQRPLVVIPYLKTRREIRRTRMKIWGAILFILLSVALAAAAVHYFYRPLDDLYYFGLAYIEKRL